MRNILYNTLVFLVLSPLFLPLPARGEYYQYRDDNGTISFTDNPASIPDKYSNSKTIHENDVDDTASMVTRIRFVNNQILVPVTVRFRDIEQSATFLLDTGATTCTISPELAKRLHIRAEDTDVGLAQGVGGSVHLVGSTELDHLTVGPYRKRKIQVSVIPTGRNDGLLGINFLQGLRYQIDIAGRQILWLD